MPVTKFSELPIAADQAWDPDGIGRAAIENEVLGSPPDWVRYKKAHLWYNADVQNKKSGYKLIIARIVEGELRMFPTQLSTAISTINGARGGVNIPTFDRRRVYNHAMKYFDLLGTDSDERPKYRMDKHSGQPTDLTLEIDDFSGEEGEEPHWVHIATEGEYLGYDNGDMPFTFSRKTFEQIVNNFKTHPAYDDGSTDIVPWDFAHASEYIPTEGSIPFTGAPSQGWTRELEIRQGEDGKAQLWALTQFLEPAREYVRDGKYKWASVSVVFDMIDPVSGENVGAYLTSVALTNTPFIEGMEKLVAMKKNKPSAMSAQDNKKQAENAANELHRSKDMELMKDLARVLGVRESDDAVIEAVKNLVDLRSDTKKLLKADKDTNAVLLQATGEILSQKEQISAEAATEKDKLSALIGALGAKDSDEAILKIAELRKTSEEHETTLARLTELEAKQAALEEVTIEEEVTEAMASRNYPDDLKDALVLLRKNNPEKFAKKFPKLTPQQIALTKNVAVTASGQDLNLAKATGDKLPAGEIIDIGHYPGVNPTERAMNCVRATHKGSDKWTHEVLFIQACNLKNREGVIDSQVS